MNEANSYQVGQLTPPLGVLIPAKDGNARKKKRTRERIHRMAVSIHMHGGVLQNLVVVPEEHDGKQTGRLEVVAGETRRLALCALRDGWIEDAKGYTDDCAPRRRTGGAILLGSHAAREMRAGPSKPAYRRRLQTTHCCCA